MTQLRTSIELDIIDAFSADLKRFRDGLVGVDTALGKVATKGDRLRKAADLNQVAEGVGRFSDLLVPALKQTTDLYGDYEAGLLDARAAGDLTVAQSTELGAAMRKLGADTKYSALEAVNAAGEFLKSGSDYADVSTLVASSMKLATAEGKDFTETQNALGTILNNSLTSMKDHTHAMDVASAMSLTSRGSVLDLAEAYRSAGQAFASSGGDIEQFASHVAVLVNAGQSGAIAGTALKSSFERMKNFANPAAKALKALGFAPKLLDEINKAASKGDLTKALTLLEGGLGGKTNQQRSFAYSEVFGLDHGASMQALGAAAASGELAKKERTFRTSDGTVDKNVQVRSGGVKLAIEELNGALEDLKLTAGESLAPALRDLAKSGGTYASSLGELAKASPEATKGVMLVVGGLVAFAGVSKLLLTVWAGVSGLGAAVTALGPALSGAVAILTGPVGLVVALAVATATLAVFLSGLNKARGIETLSEDEKKQQVLAGGTIVDENRRVVTLGDVRMAPKDIRMAAAAAGPGATAEDVNRELQRQREETAHAARQAAAAAAQKNPGEGGTMDRGLAHIARLQERQLAIAERQLAAQEASRPRPERSLGTRPQGTY